jgi:hypothetical protein
MADEQPKGQSSKKNAAAPVAPPKELSKEKIDELLARARQTVKPLVSQAQANEAISEDLLNFRMRAVKKKEGNSGIGPVILLPKG